MKIETLQHYADQWTAIDADAYDGPESPIGYGATAEEAIADLLDQIEEPSDGRCADPECGYYGGEAAASCHCTATRERAP
jgi:hypothetical protein